jgi:hypothetical protein
MNNQTFIKDISAYPKLKEWIENLNDESQSVFFLLLERISEQDAANMDCQYEKVIQIKSELPVLIEHLKESKSELKKMKTSDYFSREKELVAKRLRQLLDWSAR